MEVWGEGGPCGAEQSQRLDDLDEFFGRIRSCVKERSRSCQMSCQKMLGCPDAGGAALPDSRRVPLVSLWSINLLSPTLCDVRLRPERLTLDVLLDAKQQLELRVQDSVDVDVCRSSAASRCKDSRRNARRWCTGDCHRPQSLSRWKVHASRALSGQAKSTKAVRPGSGRRVRRRATPAAGRVQSRWCFPR